MPTVPLSYVTKTKSGLSFTSQNHEYILFKLLTNIW
jgi:hypothetical protein